MKLSNYKIVWLSSLGAGLEFFDFTIYALFAHYISLNFFPQNNSATALMNTFAIFAIGYLARPLGAILLGHIGDRHGRKHAFTYAILVMAFATLLIGCMPTYQTIGIAAPILLVLLRLIQGLSMGGEVAGAITFTLEHYEGKHKGFMQSIVLFSMSFCSTLASITGYILTHVLTAAQMLSWGWRLPFAFGFLLGLVGYLLRRNCIETPAFLAVLKEDSRHKIPFVELYRRFPKQMLTGFCIGAFSACFSSFLLFAPSYLSMHALFPANYGFAVSAVGFLALGSGSVLSGYLSDYINIKKLFILGTVSSSIIAYFVFKRLLGFDAYNADNIIVILSAILMLGYTVSIANGVYALAIAAQFPAPVRYTGIGFCQNTSFALIGGTAPLIFTALIQASNNMMAPYYYFLICTLVSLIAVLIFKNYVRK